MAEADRARALLAQEAPEEALQAAEAAGREDEVTSMCWVAEVRIAQGDFGGALKAARDAEKKATSKKNDMGAACAQLVAAKALLARDGPPEARKALALLRRMGATWAEAAVTFSIVDYVLDAMAGKLDEAMMSAAKRLPRCREASDKQGEATETLTLACIYLRNRGTAEPVDALAAAAKSLRALGVTWGDLAFFSIVEQRLAAESPEVVLEAAREKLKGASGAQALGAAQAAVSLAAFAAGDPAEAAEAGAQALESFKKASSKEGQGVAQQALAESGLARDDPDEANRAAGEALALFKALKHRRGQIGALFTLNKVLVQRGQLSEALENLGEALDLARELGDRRLEGGALHMLADVNMEIFQREKDEDPGALPDPDASREVKRAMELAEDALKLAKAAGDARGVAASLHALANVLLLKGYFQDSLDYSLRAASMAQMAKYRLGEAHAMLTATKAQLGLGADVEGAISGAEAALKIFREMKDLAAEKAALQALTDAYSMKSGPDAALQMVSREQLAYYKKVGDKRGRANMMQTLAHLHFKGNRGTEDERGAMKMAKDALQIFQDLQAPRDEALALQTVAEGHIRQGQATDALNCAKQALRVHRGLPEKAESHTKLTIQMLNTLYSALMIDGGYEEAVKCAKEAQDLCDSVDDRAGKAHELHLQVGAHIEQRDGEAAVAAAKEAIEIYEDIGGNFGHAVALHDAVSGYLVMQRDGGSEEQKEAMDFAAVALELFQVLEDKAGEAAILHAIAQLQLTAQGSQETAFEAAEETRTVALVMSNASGEAHFTERSNDFTFKAAMQAVVLARYIGDKSREAGALHTVAQMYNAGGSSAQARTAAMRAQTVYAEAGERAGVAAVQKFLDSMKEGPRRQPTTQVRYMPAPFAFGGGRADLLTNPASTVIWSKCMGEAGEKTPCIDQCLECLAFINEMTKAASKTRLIIATRGVLGRENAEVIPCGKQGMDGQSVWALLRTVKLELPRLHVSTVDVPMHARPNEIVQCFSAIQNSPDLGNEVTIRYTRPDSSKTKK